MVDLASLINQSKEAKMPHDAEVFGGKRHSFILQGSHDYDADADKKT
tara:strand:- start:85 stop:225 length:141 start_codon:yes stop_codon:yes gene_type:complete